MTVGASSEVREIGPEDLPRAAAFLHSHLNDRVSAANWAAMLRPPWSVESPNHGFMLVNNDQVVGVYAAIYSERRIDERVEPFCNLAAWCVLESFRAQGVRLLRALLAQRGFHFTDFSPSGNVIELNRLLRFVDLDVTTWLVPNLLGRAPAGSRIVTDPADARALLRPEVRALYDDHVSAKAARQIVVVDPEGVCLVVARRDRRRRMPLFASILYVSDPVVFERNQSVVYRYLLLQHGALATLVEPRVTGSIPPRGRKLNRPRPRMVKSRSLTVDRFDYLYSELVCVDW